MEGLARSGQYVSEAAGMERRIAAVLSATTDEVAHCECLTQEQRAEVYAILEALSADSAAHRSLVERLVRTLEAARA